MAIVTLDHRLRHRDGYVGAIKGVIASLAPGDDDRSTSRTTCRARDVAHAAWMMATSPRSSSRPAACTLVVVDPGVGGARREIVAASAATCSSGPTTASSRWSRGADRGVGDHRVPRGPTRPAPTFHGRDVFAPAAAALARGVPAASIGPAVEPIGARAWTGDVVVHVDVYGNLITDLRARPGGRCGSRGAAAAVRRTYEDVAPASWSRTSARRGRSRSRCATRCRGERARAGARRWRSSRLRRCARGVELEIESLAAGGDGSRATRPGRVRRRRGAGRSRERAGSSRSTPASRARELVRVVAPGPARVTPRCPLAAARACGGCPWQHVARDAQLAAKQAIVAGALRG